MRQGERPKFDEDIYIPLIPSCHIKTTHHYLPRVNFSSLWQAMTKMMERMNFLMANVFDRLNKEEKWMLRVLNIYDYNAFMMLDKEREVEQLAKVYK